MMRWYLVAILMILAVSVAPCRAEHPLVVATEGGYPPFNYINDDGDAAGFDVDIARALCRALGRECTVVTVEWDSILLGLQRNEYDMVVASMAKTPERDQIADFTTPYYRSRTNFIGNPLQLPNSDPETLAGKTIATQANTVQAQYLKTFFKDKSKLIFTEGLDESFKALADGKVDAILTDSLVGLQFLRSKQGQRFDFIGLPLDTSDPSSEACIAVKEGNTKLVEMLEQALMKIRVDGTYARINRHYFPFSIY